MTLTLLFSFFFSTITHWDALQAPLRRVTTHPYEHSALQPPPPLPFPYIFFGGGADEPIG